MCEREWGQQENGIACLHTFVVVCVTLCHTREWGRSFSSEVLQYTCVICVTEVLGLFLGIVGCSHAHHDMTCLNCSLAYSNILGSVPLLQLVSQPVRVCVRAGEKATQ